MSVASIGTPTSATTNTNAGILTATWASDQPRTAGNLLVAVYSVDGTGTMTPPAAPTGWTLALSFTATDVGFGVYTKTAAGADSPWSATLGTFGGRAYVIQYEFSGANTTTPIDTSGTGSGTASPQSVTTTANVSNAGSYAISALSTRMGSAGTGTYTPGTTWTNEFNDGSLSRTGHGANDHLAAPTSGSTLTESMAFTWAATNTGGIVVVIAPASTITTTASLATIDVNAYAPTINQPYQVMPYIGGAFRRRIQKIRHQKTPALPAPPPNPSPVVPTATVDVNAFAPTVTVQVPAPVATVSVSAFAPTITVGFTAVGTEVVSNSLSSITLSPANVGDIIVLIDEAWGTAPDYGFLTGISGGNCSWTCLGTFVNGNNANPVRAGASVWLGVATATGSAVANFTFTNVSGTVTTSRAVAQEFKPNSPTVVIDGVIGTEDNAAGVSTLAAVTPSAAGELYVGYDFDTTSATAGSTNGFVYQVDASGNCLVYNINCSASAQQPSTASTTVGSSVAVMLKIATVSPLPKYLGGEYYQRKLRVQRRPRTFIPPVAVTVSPVVPVATVDVNALAPTLTVTVAPPAATVDVNAFAPTLTVQVSPPAATVTVAGLTPTITVQAQASLATIDVTAYAPTLSQSYQVMPYVGGHYFRRIKNVRHQKSSWLASVIPVLVPTATVDVNAPAPIPSVTVTPPAATVSVSAFTPTITVQVTPPAATVSVSGLAPTVSVTINAPLATVDVNAFAPTTTVQVQAPLATIDVTAPAPVLNQSYQVMPYVGGSFYRRIKNIRHQKKPWLPSFVPVLVPTATVDVNAPAPTVSVTVSAALATVAVNAFAPVVTVQVTPPVATVSVTGLAPAVSVTFSAPLATVDVNAFAPVVTVQVTPPVATVSVAGLTPAVSVTFSAPLATVDVNALSPVVTVQVQAAVATIDVNGLAPVVVNPQTPVMPYVGGAFYRRRKRSRQQKKSWIPTPLVAVIVPTATVDVNALVPVVGVTFNAPAATVSVTGNAPVVTVQVTPPAATVSVAGFAPTVGVTFNAPVATVSVAGLAPTVTVQVLPPAATVTVAGLAPTVGVTVNAVAATVSVSGLAPVVKVQFNAPVATVTVVGLAPVPGVTVLPPTATVSVNGFAPALTVIVQPPVANVTVAGLAPTITVRVSAPFATVDVNALLPTLGVPPRHPLRLGGREVDENTFGLHVVAETFGGTISPVTVDGRLASIPFTVDGAVRYLDPLYGGAATPVTIDATVAGWTMQIISLNLAEFNDETFDLSITKNGAVFNLTGYTVNVYCKTAAGVLDTDPSTMKFSSGGGSPAITITDAVNGLAVWAMPRADIQNANITFWRVDVVTPGGLQNTAAYGPVTTTLL